MFTRTHFLSVLPLLAVSAAVATADSTTFTYTGAQQNFTVPAGVNSVTIQASGGQGGGNSNVPGMGGSVMATLPVTPGEALYIFVGQSGGDGITRDPKSPGLNSGGYADGGFGKPSVHLANFPGAGGGAASDVRQGGIGLEKRVVVAGGGGGAGGGAALTTSGGMGGAGGKLTGGAGNDGAIFAGGGGGQGGTPTMGGAGGLNSDTINNTCDAGFGGAWGAGGDGGESCSSGGAGGGGGYYGGGGGQGGMGSIPGPDSVPTVSQAGGGGGGSSFATDTSAVFTQGDHPGDGVVSISWVVCPPPTITSLTATPNVLWPPDNKMIPVALTDVVANGCGAVSCKILSVTSSEPVDPDGDWQFTDLSLTLRAGRIASRVGTKSGRVYTVTVQCTDASNNSTTKTVTVLVPLNQSPSQLP